MNQVTALLLHLCQPPLAKLSAALDGACADSNRNDWIELVRLAVSEEGVRCRVRYRVRYRDEYRVGDRVASDSAS